MWPLRPFRLPLAVALAWSLRPFRLPLAVALAWSLAVALGCPTDDPPDPPTPGDDDDATHTPIDEDGDGSPAAEDCDDGDPTVYPGADELCDGLDNDCDGRVPPAEADEDGDGYRVCDGDCRDENPDVHPGADDPCDGLDADCDGTPETDGDGDGWRTCDGDCNDVAAGVHPGAEELECTGVDEDCDGALLDGEADADGDGVMACEGDCDDLDGWSAPHAAEQCDGADNDCDGEVDESCVPCHVHVPGSHATIQDAIDAAATGDRICVAPGVWPESLVLGGAAVHLFGVSGPMDTTIDGDGLAGPVVTFADGEGSDTILEGFRVTHGSGLDGAGGGLLLDGASPTLRHLAVVGNAPDPAAEAMGGGIAIFDGSPLLDNVTVANNALYGDADGMGGGVYAAGGAPVLRRVVISDNEVGAGTGSGLGGGLYVDDASVTLENAFIVSNTASADSAFGGLGGGLFHSQGSTELLNVTLAGNLATGAGGGVGGAIVVDRGTLSALNTLVAQNEASDSGGGVVVHPDGAVDLRHCGLWGNTPDDVDGIDDPVGFDGNLAQAPGFLNTAPAAGYNWNLHLSGASLLVDAGDPGILDPDDSPSDIGAYGGPRAGGWERDRDGFPEWWHPGPYDHDSYPAAGWDCEDRDPDMNPADGC